MEDMATRDAGAVLELTVGGAAHGGWCVARDGGRVVFVRHALPGERVLARITQASARFARADAVEILSASPDRVEPPCPHARPGGCGGCDWQHASLPAQRRLKAAVVRDQLQRIAGIDWPVTVESLAPDETGLGWRTRVRYSVGPDGTAGLLGHRSHTVVDVGDCPIAHPLVRAAGVTALRWDQTSSVEVVVSPDSGERAAVVSAARPAATEPAARRAARMLAGRADTVLAARRGGQPAAVTGRGYLRRSVSGRPWRVSAGAFWQVHPFAAGALAEAALDALRPQPDEVAFDLYCGAGLFTAALAEAVGPAGTVIGVDADRAAARDARHGLRHVPWARVHVGDVAQVLGRGGWPDAGLAVLDPPRTGVTRPVIERLLAAGASGGSALRRVAYVSCDPATLARDLAVFGESGWRLAALRAFDAFPMTHHVECLALLTQPGGLPAQGS